MNKYQKFILERTLCFISKDMEVNDKKAVTNYVNDDEFMIQQDENYNIKKHNIIVGGLSIDSIEIDGKKYFILFTYVDDDYKYIFYTDNTYNEYKMLNVIFGTYEVINDNYIVKEITEELRKKKAVAIFQEVMKGLKK